MRKKYSPILLIVPSPSIQIEELKLDFYLNNFIIDSTCVENLLH